MSVKSKTRSTVKKAANTLRDSKSSKIKKNSKVEKPLGSKRNITLTESNIKNGTVNLASIISFFPASSIGESSASAGLGRPVTLYAVGQNEPIKTDIPRDKKIFRSRSLMSFFRSHNLKAGDTVSIWRISSDRYIIHPTV